MHSTQPQGKVGYLLIPLLVVLFVSCLKAQLFSRVCGRLVVCTAV